MGGYKTGPYHPYDQRWLLYLKHSMVVDLFK